MNIQILINSLTLDRPLSTDPFIRFTQLSKKISNREDCERFVQRIE